MIGRGSAILLLFAFSLLHLDFSYSYPLCTDLSAPFSSNISRAFCPYDGSTCCDSLEDSLLKKQFEALNVSDTACAANLKSVLCAKCDPFSGELFQVESNLRTVPVLCNSTAATGSGFCTELWDTCNNISITNSPFAPLQGKNVSSVNSTTSTLTDLWSSKNAFCEAYGGSSDEGLVCFNGEPVSLNDTGTTDPAKGLCIEKIGNGSYLNMVPHPDGSNRIFLANQKGQVWLATVPEEGSGKALDLDESTPFLDITDEVHFDTEFGLMGLAFHPDFTQNGRLFASFNCDKVDSPNCLGRCSCNSDVNCDPSKLLTENGAQPCQYHSVIAEFTVNTTTTKPSSASRANPSEVRRIFTMGLPFTGHHGGQILFGPNDGYLYFMMGDGGSSGDPYNFSQNKKSLLGKIMRFDIDNIPSAREMKELDLWGNYSIPEDNPSLDDKDLQPEIWALGFRNPWRCSFDSERPSYFICADIGQEVYEEVDLVSKGGNYGWRIYEGNALYQPPQSPGGNTSVSTVKPIFPITGYSHSDVNKNEGSASITGGFFYRSTTDPCLYGKYLYADLYGGAIWAADESPLNSGNFTSTNLPFSCGVDSPLSCDFVADSTIPAVGYIFSFGEDHKKDVFLLASTGVYRVVRPSRCEYTCAKENVSDSGSPASGTPTTPSSGKSLRATWTQLMFLLYPSLLIILSLVL